MSSNIVEALEQAITVKENKPKQRKTPAEQAEAQRSRFCKATRRMLDQVNKQNQQFDRLLSFAGVSGQSEFGKHRQVLENLKSALLQTKDAFNCGD